MIFFSSLSANLFFLATHGYAIIHSFIPIKKKTFKKNFLSILKYIDFPSFKIIVKNSRQKIYCISTFYYFIFAECQVFKHVRILINSLRRRPMFIINKQHVYRTIKKINFFKKKIYTAGHDKPMPIVHASCTTFNRSCTKNRVRQCFLFYFIS